LPRQRASVVLRVITGEGAESYAVEPVNLSFSGDPGPFVIDVARDATTWVMLDLEEIPAGLSILTMAFREGDQAAPSHHYALHVKTDPYGQLAIEVVDETGEPTPVLMRLTALATGKLWAIPNAIDLGPIMTAITGLDIYGPGRGYTHFFMGDTRGPYWVVPGPVDMALPPGTWEVRLHHGFEYEPVRAVVDVTANERSRQTFALKRWIDMPARGWYSGDDHVHARLMSSEDARAIMAFARAADVHVANILEMGNAERTWYAQRGFGPQFRVREGDYILVPGQEDPRSAFGHTIGLNLRAMARDLDKYMLNDWVADTIHAQGGLYGHTHVGEGFLGVHRDMTMLMPRGKSDFGSIMQNVLGTELYYDFLDLGFKLTASAGSDTPYGGAVGITRVYAYLGEGAPLDADAWFEAVRRGRTFVTNGPMIEFAVDGALPGAMLTFDADRSLRVRAKVSGLAGASAPQRLELVQCGRVVAEKTSTSPGQTVLELDHRLRVGHGFWVAVRATGVNGSQAHTTPVYVAREGFRHWNRERAAALIDERFATLDEIDELVTRAEERRAAGEISPYNYWDGRMADQAAEVRARTERVRGLYDQLRRTLEEERRRIEQAAQSAD
jgi:hypothetical protein